MPGDTASAIDARFIERALFLAERGRGRTTPNPLVGAVVVTPDGIVVGQGAHLEAGTPHAEIHALDAAGAHARGATLYCTLEPCCHVGRTGPCVERIVQAGVSRVVAAVRDPNPRVAGRGLDYLRTHGIAVIEGVASDAASRLNGPFFTWITRRRPFVTLKAAVSADGFVGRADGRVKLTGAAADRFMHRERAAIDAIAVGAGTLVIDDPLLTVRECYRFRPLTRVLFDWHARVPPGARVFSTLPAGPVIMVVLAEAAAGAAHLAALEAQGVTVWRRPDRSLGGVLEALAARDIVSLLVEGGPVLQAAFIEADLADRLHWLVTARQLGVGVPMADVARRGRYWLLHPRPRVLGEDVLLEFDVHRVD